METCGSGAFNLQVPVGTAYKLGLPQHKPSYIITPALSAPLNPKTEFEFHDPVRILTVARLIWIKGLEYGIEAMAKLKADGFRVQYTLVGDGSEYQKLLTQAEELGLKEDVIFAGKLSHKETLVQMQHCDMYIQPSLNEGFCNAILEAQAIGCLCIASDVGALPENILNNETGWLVKTRDSNELAAALKRTLNLSINERIRISEDARKRANSTFNLLSHVDSWQKFYSESK
jgi:colanic acid/amylovoran biosynthesis glycosyltransferase